MTRVFGLASVVVLFALAPVSPGVPLTWTGAAGDNYWTPSSTNWTAGAGNVGWVQNGDAVFTSLVTPNITVTNAVSFNTITVPGITGTMTIGNMSDDARKYLQGTGDATITVYTNAILALPALKGTVGVKVAGGGTLKCARSYYYSGDTTILNGTFQSTTVGTLPPSGSTVRLLDVSGASNARLLITGINSSWTFGNPIIVQAGSTGLATIENDPSSSGSFSPVLSGPIMLNSTLRVVMTEDYTTNLTFQGAISGAGTLQLKGADNNGKAQTFILSGNNTNHTGAIELLAVTGNSLAMRLRIDGATGNANITLNAKNALIAGPTGSRTLRYRIAGDAADLVTLNGTATMNLNGLTLEPVLTGVQSGSEYVVVNRTNGVSGMFDSISNRYPKAVAFAVDYDGTVLNPGKVVLTIAAAPPTGTVVIIR